MMTHRYTYRRIRPSIGLPLWSCKKIGHKLRGRGNTTEEASNDLKKLIKAK